MRMALHYMPLKLGTARTKAFHSEGFSPPQVPPILDAHVLHQAHLASGFGFPVHSGARSVLECPFAKKLSHGLWPPVLLGTVSAWQRTCRSRRLVLARRQDQIPQSGSILPGWKHLYMCLNLWQQ